MDLTRSNLLEAYRVMRLIRAFEERLHVEFATGEIPGFVHLYAGEEAIATGICLLLDERDKLTSTHRGHGHCLAKGCDIYGGELTFHPAVMGSSIRAPLSSRP